MGKAQGGGSGWVLLSYSPHCGKLVNQWAADHTTTLGDGIVVLALDMYEHSYHIDYGAKAAGYVDAYMQNINWQSVAELGCRTPTSLLTSRRASKAASASIRRSA
jgi:Fe-Mn family superoxide dismutase